VGAEPDLTITSLEQAPAAVAKLAQMDGPQSV
jgi:hypothetical protein